METLKKILDSIYSALTPAYRIIKLWPELWAIPSALVAWKFSYLITLVDPTATVMDGEFLHHILFAIVSIIAFNGAVFLGIKYNFKWIWDYYASDKIAEDFQNLKSLYKLLITAAFYFINMLLLVLLMIV